jgi:hypothetical protein
LERNPLWWSPEIELDLATLKQLLEVSIDAPPV